MAGFGRSPRLRRSLAQFEAMEQEDRQNAVVRNAAAQVRCYLALTLAGGPQTQETMYCNRVRRALAARDYAAAVAHLDRRRSERPR